MNNLPLMRDGDIKGLINKQDFLQIKAVSDGGRIYRVPYGI